MEWGRQVQGGSEIPVNQDRARLTYGVNVVLSRQQLDVDGTPGSILFTVPPQQTIIMKSFTVFNTNVIASVVTLRLVPPDGVNNSTSDWWEESVGTRGTAGELFLEEVLTPGYQIVGFADSGGVVNIKINGTVLSQQ